MITIITIFITSIIVIIIVPWYHLGTILFPFLFYVYTYNYIYIHIYIYTHMFTTIIGLLNSPYPSEFLPPQGGRAAAKAGLGVRGDADGGQGFSGPLGVVAF